MLEKISKASKTQKIIWVLAIFSLIITSVITWYLVIYQKIAKEAADWTAILISNYGIGGLLISFVARFVPFFLFWIGWVVVSRKSVRRYMFVLAFSMLFFVQLLIDLIHDLLAFGFNSYILLPLLTDPIIVIMSSVLIALLSIGWVLIQTTKKGK